MGAETDSNSLCRCVTCARGRGGRTRLSGSAETTARAQRAAHGWTERRQRGGTRGSEERAGGAADVAADLGEGDLLELAVGARLRAVGLGGLVLRLDLVPSRRLPRSRVRRVARGSSGQAGTAGARRGHGGHSARPRARCEAAEHGPPRPPLAPGGGSGARARSRQPWPPTTRRTPSQPARVRRTPALAARSCWFAQGPQTGVVPEQTRFVGPF